MTQPFAYIKLVYPRVCGGTLAVYCPEIRIVGLSPRVRGNRGLVILLLARCRSIPACAGEPPRAANRAGAGGVYPRVCGGTKSI